MNSGKYYFVIQYDDFLAKLIKMEKKNCRFAVLALTLSPFCFAYAYTSTS